MESPLCPNDPEFRLIETFGYEPGQGGKRADLHLDRMARSAAALRMAFDRPRAETLITNLTETTPKRCRLTLSKLGNFSLTTSPMAPTKPHWTVAIAPQRLNSTDPWLRHKSTRRAQYDQARANLSHGIDEVLFLNERDEVCEGTITNVFISTSSGENHTPSLTSGLLPGILRQQLLTQGYSQKSLTLTDLQSAQTVHVGNALRGPIPATLTGVS